MPFYASSALRTIVIAAGILLTSPAAAVTTTYQPWDTSRATDPVETTPLFRTRAERLRQQLRDRLTAEFEAGPSAAERTGVRLGWRFGWLPFRPVFLTAGELSELLGLDLPSSVDPDAALVLLGLPPRLRRRLEELRNPVVVEDPPDSQAPLVPLPATGFLLLGAIGVLAGSVARRRRLST